VSGAGPSADTASTAPSPEAQFAKAAQAMRDATERAALPSGDALPVAGAASLRSALPPLAPVSDARPGDRRRRTTAGSVAAGGTAAGGVVAGAAEGVEAMTLNDAASRLAEELQRIPGIERFGATRLRDLERSGPRTLRTLWGAARGELQARYGDLTIGTLLDAYQRSRQGPGAPH
jgi:hypothetical protein